jgi:hypothetical protein
VGGNAVYQGISVRGEAQPSCSFLKTSNICRCLLQNRADGQWSNWITEPGPFGFPNWSPDGHYLYYDIAFSDHPTFQRIQVGKTRSELLADLKALTRFKSRGAGPWSNVAPDGSALFVRDLSTDEIYALDLELP